LRPKYKKEYSRELLEFFKSYTVWDGGKKRAELASLAGFSRYSGLPLEELERWCLEKPDFAAAYRLGREYLLQYLIDGVFNGSVPPQTAKLLLEIEKERDAKWTGESAFELKISYQGGGDADERVKS